MASGIRSNGRRPGWWSMVVMVALAIIVHLLLTLDDDDDDDDSSSILFGAYAWNIQPQRTNNEVLRCSRLFLSGSQQQDTKTGGLLFDMTTKQKQFLPTAAVVLSTAAAAVLVTSPTPALAVEDPSTTAAIFSHQYVDPQHPLCQRRIEANKDGTSFHYVGTAVGGDSTKGKGCSPKEIKEFGLQRVSLDGSIMTDEKGILRLVLQNNDGQIIKGVWEPGAVDGAVSSTGRHDDNSVDGIRWSDGNKWTVKDKPLSTVIGEWIFLAYIGFSTLAGVKGVADKLKEKETS
jgi:hypothetical protein